MKLNTAACWATAVAASTVSAQLNPASRLVITALDSGKSNGVLEPGESALISVFVDLKDDHQNSIGTVAYYPSATGPIKGTLSSFFSAVFDISFDGLPPTGAWASLEVNPLLQGVQFPGTIVAGLGVVNIGANNFGPIVLQDDSLLLWTAEWTPSTYVVGSLSWRSIAHPGDHRINVDVGPVLPVLVDLLDGVAVLQIVPSPASCVPVLALSCYAMRRRARAGI